MFSAVLEESGKFSVQVSQRLRARPEQELRERERAFLQTLIQFIHADLLAFGIPKRGVGHGVDAVHQHGCNQFTVELTAQAMFIAGRGLMHSENRHR